jgi:hypothetical protein
MMDLVALIDDICHHIWRRGVDYGGRHNVWHVSVILVLGNVQFLVAVELTDSCQMNVTTKYGNAHRFGRSNMLQFLYEPIALFFMVLSCPMVI